MPEKTGRAKGGIATAAKMTPEERKARAMKGVVAKAEIAGLPRATHEGEFNLGESSIVCAHLPDGQRVITQATFLRALGRSRSPKAGTGVLSTVDTLPFFLQANVLKPFISEELETSTRPIFYIDKSGRKNVGYDATLLPKVAEVYLKLRDDALSKTGEIPKQHEHIIIAADILMRGLAHVGIIALVDEATGFQYDRAKNALAKILEAFIATELQPWVKTFPNEYYNELFRLRGLRFPNDSIQRPQYFGYLTNDIVYRRLAPGVLDELKKVIPKNEKGKPKARLFQKLSDNIGYPKLREHMASVVTIMKLSDNYQDFIGKLDRIHPKYNETMLLPFMYDSEVDTGTGL